MDPRSLTDLQADDITDLLHALSRPTAPADRSALEGEIVRRYRPLVRGQAARYAHRGVDKEDLAAVGDFALLKAIRRFDPDRGCFSAFAAATIRGEIKKYFRDHGWMIRPTRRIQELQAHIAEATEEHLHLGVVPDRAELAARLDVTTDDIREAMLARGHFSPHSLDATVDRGDRTLASTVGAYERGFDLVDERVTAMAACASLGAADRELIRLRFFEDRTQDEIARMIGISQMQVSRRLRRILLRLHSIVTEGSDPQAADLRRTAV